MTRLSKIFFLSFMILFSLAFINAKKIQAQTIQQTDDIKSRFDYPVPFGITRIQEVKPFDSYFRPYKKYQGHFVSYTPENTPYFNYFEYYKSSKSGKRPLVLILPVLRGVTLVETTMAKHLASHGIHALVTHLTEDISDITRPLTDFDGFLIRATTAVRSSIDIWSERDEVDPERIGGIGSSLGGIRLLITMGVEPRIKAGATFVAGGDLPEIMTYSDIDFFGKIKKKIKGELGITDDRDYTQFLRNYITIDPLVFSKDVDRDDITMAISHNDNTVPTSNQYKAWQHFERPFSYIFRNPGHTLSVILSLTKKAKIIKFLNERWELKTGKSLEAKFLIPDNNSHDPELEELKEFDDSLEYQELQ